MLIGRYRPLPGSLLTPVTWISSSLCTHSHYPANRAGHLHLTVTAHCCFHGHATTVSVCVCVRVCAQVCMHLCVCVCVWLPIQARAAGVTAPLPKVTSKESRANYYADQSWWRLRGLLRCNHISWPERNLQADPNHRGYSARVSQDGGLPPMFSFHKTLFSYLEQARDYQAKQPSSSTLGSLQTCTCIYIYIFKECIWIATHTVHSCSQWHFGCKMMPPDGRLRHRQTTRPCSQLTTVIWKHVFALSSPSISPCSSLSLPLVFKVNACLWSAAVWRADCNLLSPCGWGVCVQVVNMPPLCLFFFFSPSAAPFLSSVSSFPAARMASNETEFDQVASVFLERSHLSHWPVMESASNAYINHTHLFQDIFICIMSSTPPPPPLPIPLPLSFHPMSFVWRGGGVDEEWWWRGMAR